MALAQAELEVVRAQANASTTQIVDDDYASVHEVDKSSRPQQRGSSSDFETPKKMITNVSNAPLMLTRDLTAKNAPLRPAKRPVTIKLEKGQPKQVAAQTST